MKKPHLYILYFTFFGFAVSNLTAQDYADAFNEGQQLYNQEQYYEAYLRFNAAEVLSDNAGKQGFAEQSQEWLDKAAYGIQRQQVVTDSLLQATRKLTDAFYFWDGRLALAFKYKKYGYINKAGEVVIDFNYQSATNFDEETGYARVIKGAKTFWLAPDGQEYIGSLPIDSLPRVERSQIVANETTIFQQKKIDAEQYVVSRKQDQHAVLQEGIQLFNDRKYYEAYLRFNAAAVLAENAADKKTARWGRQLKDTAIFQIKQLLVRANDALRVAENIRDAFYFYDDKFALAFNDNHFYFIDQEGNEIPKLGRWKKARHFDLKGFASVEKEDLEYLLDSTGQIYRVAFTLTDLDSDVTALDLRQWYVNRFPFEILEYPQLEVLLMDGDYAQWNQLGDIPAGIQRLKNLKFASFENCGITSLPIEVGQLKQLLHLDLRNNQLASLPASIKDLSRLVYLDIGSDFPFEGNRQLTTIPPALFQLKNLKHLDLTYNPIQELPTEIGALSGLTELQLQNTKLESLPASIGQLKQLIILGLGNNNLQTLPTEFGQLKSLKGLNLSGNNLTHLPASIGKLTNLKFVTLLQNELTELPDELAQLNQLEILTLSSNQLQRLPDEFGELSNLRDLDLSNNQLIELPTSFAQLGQLKKLGLGHNPIDHLPKNIGQLERLETLYLRNSKLTALPGSIGALSQLKTLNLVGNPLKKLPNSIGQLGQLTELRLSETHLRDLPDEFGLLENLERLEVDFSQIQELPSTIGNLKKLEHFNLNRTPLKSIPAGLGQLTMMQQLKLRQTDSLDLATLFHAFADHPKAIHMTSDGYKVNLDPDLIMIAVNPLYSISPEISRLKNLRKLDLSFCQVKEVPAEIGALQNLTTLNLSSNQIAELPTEIGNLQNLDTLDLSRNRLSAVPASIGQLQQLELLDLSDNKLTTLPPKLGNLGNLKSLNLSSDFLNDNNRFQTLPIAVLQLKNLTELDLMNVQMEELLPEINQLEYLEKLNLGSNRLTKIPSEISALSNLQFLNLEKNPIPEDDYPEIKALLPDCQIEFTKKNYLEIGLNALDNQQYEQALEAFEQAIIINQSPEAYANAGLCCRLLGKSEKALEYLNDYLDLVPDDLWAIDQIALTYEEMKDYSNAYAYTKKATELKPDDFNQWYNLSYYALFVDQPDEAIRAAQKTLELEPQATGVETNLALGYLLNDQWTEAEKIYKKWKGKSFPDDDRLWDEIFLQDLNDLEVAGITHPDFEKVSKLLKE